MQRTVRILRYALPVVFLGFLLLLVFSWDRSGGRKEKAASEPVTSTQRPDDRPQAESRAFEDVQTIGGRVVSRISAERVVAFESGWTTLEKATLTLYRENGLTYVVSCPQAQFNSQTKEAEAKGGVRVTSSDGVDIATAEIRYDGSRLMNDIPVQFKVDRWAGRAGALDLDVVGETLRLHKTVDATMSSSNPAEQAMNLNAASGMFKRRENIVEFHEGVEMNRAADRIRSDHMVGRFTPDRKRITALEGDGNVVIVTAGNQSPGADFGGRKEITCDGFFTELGPDGRIHAFNTKPGANLARAVMDGPPRRDIVAQTFRVALANNVVSEVRGDLNVIMRELGEMDRRIEGQHVTLWFDPMTKKARSAFIDGGFKYKDPKNSASSFRANYDIEGDRIVLTTDPGWQATVVTDGNTLKAKQIEFAPKAQTARAIGAVIAQLASRGKTSGATADATTLFPSGKPVFVNADELIMRQAQKTALFTGNVKAWQESNTILANEMQVQGNGEIVTARGNVRSLLFNTSPEARKTPVQSRSEQIVARRGDRKIEMLGNVRIQDETRILDAARATFFFDEARKLQRIESEEKVAVVENATGRKGSGNKAVYQVDRRMIYMFGAPARVSDRNGELTGEEIVFDLARDRVRVNSKDEKTKGTYRHEGP